MKLSEISLTEQSHASLFHGTLDINLIDILRDNELKENEPDYGDLPLKGVSLTRNIDVAKSFGHVVFELDQNKLKQNYKIVPFRYPEELKGNSYIKDEAEEFLVGTLKNLNRYTIKIWMFQTKEQYVEFEKKLKIHSQADIESILNNNRINWVS